MKIIKAIFNVLGIFLATLFSIILIVMLIVTPTVSAVSSFLRADTLHNVVKNIDANELLRNFGGDRLPTEINGMDVSSIIDELLKSEMVEDILSIYIENIFSTIEGSNSASGPTAETIEGILNKHIDSLLPMVKAQIGTEVPLTDENIKMMAKTMIKSLVPNFMTMLPTLEDLGLDPTTIRILQNLYNGNYFKYMLFASGLVSLLILLLRFPRFKGFMWLGVVYLLSAILVFMISLLTKTSDVLNTIAGDMSEIEFILTPLLVTLAQELSKGAGIIAILGIVCILIFAIGRKLTPKQSAEQSLAA